jgi:hypothetical protein
MVLAFRLHFVVIAKWSKASEPFHLTLTRAYFENSPHITCNNVDEVDCRVLTSSTCCRQVKERRSNKWQEKMGGTSSHCSRSERLPTSHSPGLCQPRLRKPRRIYYCAHHLLVASESTAGCGARCPSCEQGIPFIRPIIRYGKLWS